MLKGFTQAFYERVRHMGRKFCPQCLRARKREFFAKDSKRYDGLNGYCKECLDVLQKLSRSKKPLKYKKIADAWIKKHPHNTELKRKQHYARRMLTLLALKTFPCVDCNNMFHPAAMDFDHRVGTIKKATISDLVKSKHYKLMREINKCDLVCSNCHRVRTYKRSHLEAA